jgi:hypothetical protein
MFLQFYSISSRAKSKQLFARLYQRRALNLNFLLLPVNSTTKNPNPTTKRPIAAKPRRIANPIQSGDNTHHHDHAITPHNLSVMKTIASKPRKLIPAAITISVRHNYSIAITNAVIPLTTAKIEADTPSHTKPA